MSLVEGFGFLFPPIDFLDLSQTWFRTMLICQGRYLHGLFLLMDCC